MTITQVTQSSVPISETFSVNVSNRVWKVHRSSKNSSCIYDDDGGASRYFFCIFDGLMDLNHFRRCFWMLLDFEIVVDALDVLVDVLVCGFSRCSVDVLDVLGLWNCLVIFECLMFSGDIWKCLVNIFWMRVIWGMVNSMKVSVTVVRKSHGEFPLVEVEQSDGWNNFGRQRGDVSRCFLQVRCTVKEVPRVVGCLIQHQSSDHQHHSPSKQPIEIDIFVELLVPIWCILAHSFDDISGISFQIIKLETKSCRIWPLT